MDQETLLLVLPVPMRRINGCRYVESQAINGLLRWSDNFDSIIATLVCYPAKVADGLSGIRWEGIDNRRDFNRITIVELPYGYEPLLHYKFSSSIKETLRMLIAKSRYLCFAIGGYFGDWGSVAAFLAKDEKRKFAVWTDRVESSVIWNDAKKKRNWIRKAYSIAYSGFVRWYERQVIQQASLGLFHGADTFNAYRHYVEQSFEVHNIHLTPSQCIAQEGLSIKGISEKKAFIVHDVHMHAEDRISPAMVEEKARVSTRDKLFLNVGYAGRAAEMKAPMDWLKVVQAVDKKGVKIVATWLGDGPLLKSMVDFVKGHGLENIVELPGFIAERDKVIASLRKWDILLFTHVTPESPRILLEAMISGTPIVGYDGAYARELVSGFGDSYLVPIGSTEELAEKLVQLHYDRTELGRLMRDTYQRSEGFNDIAVFKHRSDIIKRLLG